jgi:probable H4MPT-linked C1 transfer pathway protein
LRQSELVYTGALRTPAEAVAQALVLSGAPVGVSAEGFALVGDAHLWLGSLAPEDYTVPTPDGRPATREFAGERLARVVCADRELLDAAAVDAIARGLAEAQVRRVSEAVVRVRRRHPSVDSAVVTGLGDFIAAEAARRAGLRVTHLSLRHGAAGRHAAAAAVALLLEAELAPHEARP